MSAREYEGSDVLDEQGNASDSDNQSIENIAPSLAPKAKNSVPALITKHIAKVTFVAVGIVLILGFIHAIQYPRTRTVWEYKDPIIRRQEGVLVVYERITSPVPCDPKNLTDRWVAYNEYKDASLKGKKTRKDWGKPPDCSLTDILTDQEPVCWVITPNDECNPHVTWQDLHEQRDEACQQAEGAEVQGVHPSSPTGEISTDIKLAKGTRKLYSCTTVIARNRYAGDEEWGQWEEISNCSFTKVNGTKAIELRIERKELALEGVVVATHKVTLLTKWPTSHKREFQAFLGSVSPEVDNSYTPRALSYDGQGHKDV